MSHQYWLARFTKARAWGLLCVGVAAATPSVVTAIDEFNSCHAAFTKVYQQLYLPQECPRNVHVFLQNLKDKGVALQNVRVLFFKDPFPPAHYRNHEARGGWDWHVIAEHQGLVYDFDYAASPGNPSPEVLTVKQYVDKNLGGVSESTRGIRIRAIAGDFFDKFWMRPLSFEGPRARIRMMDADYMKDEPLGDSANDITVSDWVNQFSN
jgi:hypothetical protein